MRPRGRVALLRDHMESRHPGGANWKSRHLGGALGQRASRPLRPTWGKRRLAAFTGGSQFIATAAAARWGEASRRAARRSTSAPHPSRPVVAPHHRSWRNLPRRKKCNLRPLHQRRIAKHLETHSHSQSSYLISSPRCRGCWTCPLTRRRSTSCRGGSATRPRG